MVNAAGEHDVLRYDGADAVRVGFAAGGRLFRVPCPVHAEGVSRLDRNTEAPHCLQAPVSYS